MRTVKSRDNSAGHGYHGKVTFEALDRFGEALRCLRYEGKPSRGKNLKRISESMAFFGGELAQHMAQEERELFPFLTTHIPKLEPLITLLLSEHHDFRNGIKRLNELFLRLKKAVPWDPALVDEVEGRGAYLIYLLRNHIWIEEEIIGRSVRQELRADEKKVLAKALRAGSERPRAAQKVFA